MIKGGHSFYGYKIGILVLDSGIPRIPGDIGNATTYNFPVVYKVVSGATISRVVGDTDPTLLELFIQAARELEREGCKAITTSCGFLAIFQRELAAAVNIPVFTSSLLQVPFVYSMLAPGRKIGVITAEKESLSIRHLKGVGIEDIPLVISGLDDCACMRAFRSSTPSFDPEQMRLDVIETAQNLVNTDPMIGAIVVECTNMPPYSAAIQAAVGLPVFDIITLINYMQMGLNQKEYQGYM
jgi:Asp/Glu/hydantoin racemase